jgi:hypothetical protein
MLKYDSPILTVLCVFLFSSVLACLHSFRIEVSGEDPFLPIFKLEKSIFSTPLGTSKHKLTDFTVYKWRDGQWDYENPVWSFSRKSSESLAVYSVQYSRVPAGFREYTRAAELSPGIRYYAVARTEGGVGTVQFSIVVHGSSHRLEILNN